MRGGVPSITQPIAGPWLSPQVVTRNKVPKLLLDIPLSDGQRLGLKFDSISATAGAASTDIIPTTWYPQST